jgi:hypothetical protein
MMRVDRGFQLLQGALLIAAAVAACGGPSTEPATPESTGGGEEPAAGGAPSGETPAPAPEPGQAPPISASQQLAEVAKLGINMKKIPELQKLPLPQKKKVMPFFQKSLGYKACGGPDGGCHATDSDFKTETRNMKVARDMWNHFVVNLRDDKGGNVFCDSCHNGKTQLLARGDVEALKKFMEAEYVGKLDRGDKQEHSCGTCHGDPFEGKIIEKLWKIPPK